ncbi:MAG: hypothetical protein JRF15_14910 [Deltaproteobacteria bacterium]|nr:hypothetical protein [Deltaproteobacteria bacterium]
MNLHTSLRLLALLIPLLHAISAKAQSGDVNCAAIVDADGTRVARAMLDVHAVQFFYKGHDGFAVPLSLSQQTIRGTANRIWFTDENCSEIGFIEIQSSQPTPTSVRIGQDVYYVEPFAMTQEIQAYSYMSDQEGCQPTNPNPTSVDATPVTHEFALPQYTPPFTVEPEDCSAPPEPDPERIVYGCVKHQNGALRIVEGPADCNAREAPISWLRQ